MKDMNKIDELFRRGTQKHFPLDEGLWAAVESQLPSNSAPKTPWFYSLNSIVLIVVLLTCSFIPKDNTRNTGSELYASKEITNTKIADYNNSLKTKTGNQPQSTTPTSNELQQNAKAKRPETETPKATSIENNSTAENKLIEPSKIKEGKKVVPTNKKEPTIELESRFNSTTSSILQQSNVLTGFNSSINVDNTDEQPRQKLLHAPLLSEFILINKDQYAAQPKVKGGVKKYPKSNTFYNVELEALFSTSTSKQLSGESENYLTAKSRGEKSVELRTLGLNLIGQKKFLIYGLGLQQTQYTERFSYAIHIEKNRLVTSFDTNYRIVNGNFNSNGIPVLLIEQEITQNQFDEAYTGKEVVTGLNTYKWVGIPIFIGITKSYKNWQAQARFSIISQFSYQQSGYFLNKDLNSLSALSEDNFSTVHFSNRNDLSLGYSFHEQFAVGAKYAMLQDLNSFTKDFNSQITGQILGIWILWKP